MTKADKLTIVLELGNAAFDPPGPEIQRVLTDLGATLADFNRERDSHRFPLLLRDHNGNTVGEVHTA